MQYYRHSWKLPQLVLLGVDDAAGMMEPVPFQA